MAYSRSSRRYARRRFRARRSRRRMASSAVAFRMARTARSQVATLRRTIQELLTPVRRWSYKWWAQGSDAERVINYSDCYVHVTPHNDGAAGVDVRSGSTDNFYSDNEGLGFTAGQVRMNHPMSGSDNSGNVLECARTMMWEPYVLRVICGTDASRFQQIHEQDLGQAPMVTDAPQHIRRGRDINVLNYNVKFRIRMLISPTAGTIGDWYGDGDRDRNESVQYVRALFVEVFDMGGGDNVDNTAARRDASSATTPQLTYIYQHPEYKWHTTEAMGLRHDFSNQTVGLRPPTKRFHAPMIQEILKDMPPEDVPGLTTDPSALYVTDESVLERRYLSGDPVKNGTADAYTAQGNDPATFLDDGDGANAQLIRRDRRFRVLFDKSFAFQTHDGRDGTRQVDFKFSRPLGKIKCTPSPANINGTGRRYFWYFMPSVTTSVNGSEVAAAQGQHSFKTFLLEENITYRDSEA